MAVQSTLYGPPQSGNAAAHYVINGADSSLPNAQNISGITSPVVKITAGTIAASVVNTDYGQMGRLGPWFESGLTKSTIARNQVLVDCGTFQGLEKWAVAAGTWTAVTDTGGGAVQNNSTAGGTLVRRTATPGTNPICLANQKFYVAGTMRNGSGAIAVGQNFEYQFTNPGTGIGLSIGCDRANISSTNFGAYAYDGVAPSGVASTKAIDAAWHYWELWSPDGATYFFAFDGESALQLTTHLPAGSTQLSLSVLTTPNGSASAFAVGSWFTMVPAPI